ncbi:FAD-dependent oxidoreductase [uncultured Jatrophihabitans sp.]|uniref:oxidoreductase n=1 Tax=uncultured Jatrophihabitans sp. TaxID=1610747 RepID=UPI0035CB4E5E
MTFPLLLSPIAIGRREVRNRVVITSHGASEAFRAPGGHGGGYLEYLRRRAAGGAGLIITQPPFFAADVQHSPEVLDRHAALAAAVRGEGAAIVLQLAHLGAFGRSESDVHRPPLWSFSPVQSAAGETSHEMTDDEVEELIGAYRRTARLAADAGFDGVEVHGGHGYLIQQSLTPGFNRRTDRWGADRTLFARRVLAAAREEIGPDGIVGYRTTTNDLRDPDDGGMGFARGVGYLRAILADGHVDVLNTTIGDGGPSYARAIPDYRWSEAPNIPAVQRLREAADVRVPVIGVGRIASPGVAEATLRSGACDLVAMTRAHIADPDLVAKVRAGRTELIRPCVGANVCVNRKLAGFAEISCFHNPEVLREAEVAVVAADVARRVLVVGGGPAGLKAAEVAARRGHRVVLADADGAVGGRLRWAAATRAAALVASVEHVAAALVALGVERVRTTVTEDYLRAAAPDAVVLATGGRADPRAGLPPVPSAGPAVYDPVDALAAPPPADLGADVVVYDLVGANEGALTAEALAGRGHRVVYVTPFEIAMPHGGQLHRVQLPETLHGKTAGVLTRAMIGAVEDKAVVVVTSEGAELATLAADAVVVVRSPDARLELVAPLERLGIEYHVVGDALAPRQAMQAFKDGHEAALRI